MFGFFALLDDGDGVSNLFIPGSQIKQCHNQVRMLDSQGFDFAEELRNSLISELTDIGYQAKSKDIVRFHNEGLLKSYDHIIQDVDAYLDLTIEVAGGVPSQNIITQTPALKPLLKVYARLVRADTGETVYAQGFSTVNHSIGHVVVGPKAIPFLGEKDQNAHATNFVAQFQQTVQEIAQQISQDLQ